MIRMSMSWLHRRQAPRACALAVVGLAGCGGADAFDPSAVVRDPAVRGPWQVGVTTIEVADPAWPTRTLTVEIWYPATFADDAPRDVQLGIELSSVRGAVADPRGAPFPLVGFSHGNQGARFQSVYLTEHLASHGYVVVGPDHVGNTFGDQADERAVEVMHARPHDVKRAIDAAVAHAAAAADPLAGMIDPATIAMVGHSYGAYTTLVLAGARLELPALRAACAADPGGLVCDAVDDTLTEAVVDGWAEPRLAAAIALAPAGRVGFGAAGLAAVDVPVHVQGGTLDSIATPDGEVTPIFEALPPARGLGMVTGAGHFSFTDICTLYELLGGPDGSLADLATEGCGPNTIPVARAQAASRTLATAFLDRELRGLADDHGYLDPARGVADATLR
jgi:predicted dienelactone hydrolase